MKISYILILFTLFIYLGFSAMVRLEIICRQNIDVKYLRA